MSLHCGLFPFNTLYSRACQSEALHVPHPCIMGMNISGMTITEYLLTE